MAHIMLHPGHSRSRPAPTLDFTVTPPDPSIPDDTVLGATVATLQGVWSDGKPFTGGYVFVSPNFDDGGIYAITMNLDHSGNLIINPDGPGVSGEGGSIDDVTIEAWE